MNKQELRRLGVLPYEDTPDSRSHTNGNRVVWGEGAIIWGQQPIRMPQIRRHMPELLAEQIVGVQPMANDALDSFRFAVARTTIEPRARRLREGHHIEQSPDIRGNGVDFLITDEVADVMAAQITQEIDNEILNTLRRRAEEGNNDSDVWFTPDGLDAVDMTVQIDEIRQAEEGNNDNGI